MENEIYVNGAARSGKKPRYRDINTSLLRRIATAFAEGVSKYEEPLGLPPWEKNWEKGDIVFALDAIDHAIEHLLLYRDSVKDRLHGFLPEDEEDHLGHLGANLVMLSEFEERSFWEPETWQNTTATTDEMEGPVEPVDNPTDIATSDDRSVVQKILGAFGITS